MRSLCIRSAMSWASSVGGPGLNLEEQRGERSMLGTLRGMTVDYLGRERPARTDEALSGSQDVWLCYLDSQSADDGRLSQSDER
jgi:hypothetical protein